MKHQTVRISQDTHEKLVAHTEKTEKKIGRFVDKAVLEKINREVERVIDQGHDSLLNEPELAGILRHNVGKIEIK